jgi:hypothetical protein
MTEESQRVSVGRLILWPAVITLAITVLRLVGELQHWSPKLFNPEPGGGGALIGISWLPFVFGVYFALKLCAAGDAPASTGRAILMPLLGVAVVIAASVAAEFLISKTPTVGYVVAVDVAALVALVLQRTGWPALFKTLLAYAFAARIPVALIMLAAIRGNWGTHYDVAPTPEFPAMHWLLKWLIIGALPQFVIWIAYTVIVGGLMGAITAAILRRRAGSQQAATA